MIRRAFLRSVIVGTLAAPLVTRQVKAFAAPDVWRDGDFIPQHLRGLLEERALVAGHLRGEVITAAIAERFIPKAVYAPTLQPRNWYADFSR